MVGVGTKTTRNHFRKPVEWQIIKNPSTGVLAFVAGNVDMTSPYFLQVPLIKDTRAQAPKAICALVSTNVQRNVILNRSAPPFDKPELRRAVALSVDRKAFIATLTQGWCVRPRHPRQYAQARCVVVHSGADA
jgi:ABC-type transport system substrate-binding protein